MKLVASKVKPYSTCNVFCFKLRNVVTKLLFSPNHR